MHDQLVLSVHLGYGCFQVDIPSQKTIKAVYRQIIFVLFIDIICRHMTLLVITLVSELSEHHSYVLNVG